MNGREYPDDYMIRLMRRLNEQVDSITTSNFDDMLKEAKDDIDNYYSDAKSKYNEAKNRYREIKRNETTQKKTIIREENKQKEDIINKNLNKMTVGQDNVKEASRFTRFYKYSVKIVEHTYTDKSNFVFAMDNNFFKKLLSKPTDRLRHKISEVRFQSVVFKYKPKKERELIDGDIIYFQPFEIVLNTKDCHDMVYYHIEDNGNKSEILKCLYIINLQKVIDRLTDMFEDLYLSDKAKSNMMISIKKHMVNVQSPEEYGVYNYEDYHGLSEEQALIILDDFDDGELGNSLGNYILD